MSERNPVTVGRVTTPQELDGPRLEGSVASVDQANLLDRAHAAIHAVGNALTGHIGPAIANGARAVSTFGPNPEVSQALGRTLLSDNPDYVQSVLVPQRLARQEGFKRA